MTDDGIIGDVLEEMGERLAERRDYIAELERENELLAADLEQERIARLEVDNRVAHLEAAIALHRQSIRSLDFGVNGREADEMLWWWVQ